MVLSFSKSERDKNITCHFYKHFLLTFSEPIKTTKKHFKEVMMEDQIGWQGSHATIWLRLLRYLFRKECVFCPDPCIDTCIFRTAVLLLLETAMMKMKLLSWRINNWRMLCWLWSNLLRNGTHRSVLLLSEFLVIWLLKVDKYISKKII